MKNKIKTQKQIWFTVLFVSIVAVWVLASAPLEVYFDINMPFVTINMHQFTCFGYEIPNSQQMGLMMMSGLLLMLPTRTLHLAMLKLDNTYRMERKYKEDMQSLEERSFYDQMERDATGGY
jgi:hypothetical protein